jgi:hypothetical protein
MKKLQLTSKNYWLCKKDDNFYAVPALYFTTPNALLSPSGFVATQHVLGTKQQVTYMIITSRESVDVEIVPIDEL